MLHRRHCNENHTYNILIIIKSFTFHLVRIVLICSIGTKSKIKLIFQETMKIPKIFGPNIHIRYNNVTLNRKIKEYFNKNWIISKTMISKPKVDSRINLYCDK